MSGTAQGSAQASPGSTTSYGSRLIRYVTSSMRAVFSARSMWRDIQKSSLAVRQSIVLEDCCLGSKHPGVLRAPALRRVDDERPFAERNARESPGNEVRGLRRQNVRPQVDVARRKPVLDERGARGKRERGLRNILLGRRQDTFPERGELGRGGARADQHPVAA